MDKRNSVKCRVLMKNPDVYFVGSHCHIDHNERRNREDSFSGFVRIPAFEKIFFGQDQKSSQGLND